MRFACIFGSFNPCGKAWLCGLLFLGSGLFFAFYPSAASGFYFLPGGCDGRLNHYFLEHSWLWLTGSTLHAQFWDAPFFYPHKNVMAYSDILLGSAPIYWLCRLVGCGPINAFLLWVASLAVLNWVCMYLLLSRILRLDCCSAGGGAYLFAFCAPRLYRLVHLQLWPQFYSVLFIYALAVFYRHRNTPNHIGLASLCPASLCLALQFYAGYYLGWFLLLGACIYIVCLFLGKNSRAEIIMLCKASWRSALLAGGLFVLMVWPMLAHYLEMRQLAGLRPWEAVSPYLPGIHSWFATPAFVYQGLPFIHDSGGEHLIGAGFVTVLVALYGLIAKSANNIWIRSLLVCTLLLFALATFGLGNWILWKMVYLFFPGAGAIRAVTRIFFLLVLPLSIGYALAISRQKFYLRLALIGILLVENATWGVMANERLQYEYAMRIAQEARKADLPFLYASDGEEGVFDKNLDAMWAGLLANRLTYNGYSGNFPDPAQYEAGSFDKMDSFASRISEPYLLILRKENELISRIVNPGSLNHQQ